MDSYKKRYITFCKPYIDATQHIYETMVSTQLKTGTAAYKRDLSFDYDYSAIIGNSGTFTKGESPINFKSIMVLSWPKDVYLKSAGKMLMEEISEYSAEVSDVGMEITNIVTGGAKTVLYELGFEVKMAIPTSIWGHNHRISSQVSSNSIVMPLKSDLGTFYIQLNYEEE
ncbi:MAG: chemotaxis protein CheX [Gammaproteobacteria bacterium]|nr:chemotaxis protein CheX [Gammaproteobacteria bacterium]